ncbi:haloacid dehalogenase domain protein hydrolase [Leadbettera azotonutricia ZAS-9]|uniref:phosphoglycolate phosphatase n=1 Tax=Leadbettera azotonutricia (strain ATCC BAA-888 / DSM 13862 / ZAS-9) TaxID=545695 RepID=F5YCJ8_LEAAZ|nr:haloacid dehalogenase domain protein hydrolase [Leadbettera azotonutricia ZAS-9]
MACPWEAPLLLAERKTRKSLAGCDYGGSETYYHEFLSRLSLATRKPEPFLRSWYFDSFMPRMCKVLKKHYQHRPGLPELFKTLARKGLKFAVYSDYPMVAERLHSLGLNPESCGLIFGPENFGAQKPAARPFLSIAEAMNVPPKETLVVGDREDSDGAGAAAAGMSFFKIETGGDWEEFLKSLNLAS